MAKRKKHKRKQLFRAQRDNFKYPLSKRRLRPLFLEKERKLYEIEDWRKKSNWIESPRKISGKVADISTAMFSKSGRRVGLRYDRMRFVDPRNTIICKRRRAKREALFAIRKIGKGKGTGKFKRRIINEFSKVRCS